MKTVAKEGGAALLLMLVFVIVAAAALLMRAFDSQGIEALRERRTLAQLAQASDALIGFAATNGRLPRPADAASAGREREQPCGAPDDCSGFLPWVTLGVDATDSWGKLLRYSVTPAYTTPPILRVSAVADRRVQRRDGEGTLFNAVGQDQCQLAAQCAPAIVLSQGRRNLGTDAHGVRQANGARNNIDEINNDRATVGFIERQSSDSETFMGGPFDDLLLAVPLDILYERMAAAKTLP